MQESADTIVATLGIVVALSIAYGRIVGPLQTDITQAIIDAWQVPSNVRRLLNLGVGTTLGVAVAIVGALAVGSWAVVPAGILAGVMASSEAARVHDADTAYQAGAAAVRQALRPPTRMGAGSDQRRAS